MDTQTGVVLVLQRFHISNCKVISVKAEDETLMVNVKVFDPFIDGNNAVSCLSCLSYLLFLFH